MTTSATIALVPTERCPVCGAADREAADGMSTGGTVYLRHAAAPLGLSVHQLIDRVHVYRCLSCGGYFCDPWLSPELASHLFCAGAPDHIAGWAGFEQWLRGASGDVVSARNRRLLSAVTRRIGPVSTYAEFGCPFQGFLLHFRGSETTSSERLESFSLALHRPGDPRWTRLARIDHLFRRISSAAIMVVLRGTAVLDSMLGRRTADAPIASDRTPAVPSRRYLLTEDTSKGWGSNCVRYGATCQYFAHAVLGADALPLDEVQAGSARFDLIAVFNSLDHSTFPVEVLRKALILSNHVLVVTHDASHAGRQHLYAFGERFGAWLTGALAGVSVEDLRSEVETGDRHDYNYLLLSRTPDQATIAS